MFFNVSTSEMLFVVLGSAGLLLFILLIAYGKKLLSLLGLMPTPALVAAGTSPQPRKWQVQDDFPPLIDKPADHPVEQARVFEADEDQLAFTIAEGEGPTTFLREADLVVAEIQEAVDGIEARPANPDEVCSKIRGIVSQYRIFLDTEYFDAINNFIAITVQRDCDLVLTQDDLQALWFAQAA